MKAPGFILRLMRFQSQHFLLLILINIIQYGARLAFGLIIQAFFNALPISTSANAYLWSLPALMVTIALARMLFGLVRINISLTYMFSLPRLIHRNLLRRLLELPGAR